ncbi:MAG: WD40 repeat domain-containing protein [Gemmataceae bacterium]
MHGLVTAVGLLAGLSVPTGVMPRPAGCVAQFAIGNQMPPLAIGNIDYPTDDGLVYRVHTKVGQGDTLLVTMECWDAISQRALSRRQRTWIGSLAATGVIRGQLWLIQNNHSGNLIRQVYNSALEVVSEEPQLSHAAMYSHKLHSSGRWLLAESQSPAPANNLYLFDLKHKTATLLPVRVSDLQSTYFSPDTEEFVHFSENSEYQRRKLRTGELISHFPNDRHPLADHPDGGTYFAVPNHHNDGPSPIGLYDRLTHRLVQPLKITARVARAEFRADGRQLLNTGNTAVHPWSLWNLQPLEQVYSGNDCGLPPPRYSPNGRFLSCGTYRDFWMIDTTTLRPIQDVPNILEQLVVLPGADGTHEWWGLAQGRLRRWDLSRGVPTGPEVSLPGLAVCQSTPLTTVPGTPFVLYPSNLEKPLNTVTLYNHQTREVVAALPKFTDFEKSFLTSKSVLLPSTHSVQIYDVLTGKPRGEPIPLELTSRRLFVQLTPDEKSLLTIRMWASGDKTTVLEVWDVATNEVKRQWSLDKQKGEGTFVQDSTRPIVYVLRCYQSSVNGHEGRLMAYNYATGELLWDQPLFSSPASSNQVRMWFLQTVPNSRELIFQASDGTLRLHDAITGHEIRRLQMTTVCHSAFPTVTLSPDGRWLMAVHPAEGLTQWDLRGEHANLPPICSPAELPNLWDALGGADAPAAYYALQRLRRHPDLARPYLLKKLKQNILEPEKVQQHLASLDAVDFATRDAARRWLALQGSSIRKELQFLRQNTSSTEARAAVDDLLELQKNHFSILARREQRGQAALAWMAEREARLSR